MGALGRFFIGALLICVMAYASLKKYKSEGTNETPTEANQSVAFSHMPREIPESSTDGIDEESDLEFLDDEIPRILTESTSSELELVRDELVKVKSSTDAKLGTCRRKMTRMESIFKQEEAKLIEAHEEAISLRAKVAELTEELSTIRGTGERSANEEKIPLAPFDSASTAVPTYILNELLEQPATEDEEIGQSAENRPSCPCEESKYDCWWQWKCAGCHARATAEPT
jgi:chromosome segregation ATPase